MTQPYNKETKTYTYISPNMLTNWFRLDNPIDTLYVCSSDDYIPNNPDVISMIEERWNMIFNIKKDYKNTDELELNNNDNISSSSLLLYKTNEETNETH